MIREYSGCHPERSEGSDLFDGKQIRRLATTARDLATAVAVFHDEYLAAKK